MHPHKLLFPCLSDWGEKATTQPGMKAFLSLLLAASIVAARDCSAAPALTIYNQDFAVVRETVPLDLKTGRNEVRFIGATMYVEPSSVVLRDPTSKHQFQVLEQDFRADPVSQELLLSLNEGKTIDFEVTTYEGGQA